MLVPDHQDSDVVVLSGIVVATAPCTTITYHGLVQSQGSMARVSPCCWQPASPLIPMGSAQAASCAHLAEGASRVTKPLAPSFLGWRVMYPTGAFLPSPGTAGLQGSRWELRAQFPGKCSEICLCYSPKAFGRFQPEELLFQEAAGLRSSY